MTSFVATGFWSFFRVADTPFLLATPLPVRQLFCLRATETFVLTSWAFVVAGLPAVLALGSAHGRGIAFYLPALVVLSLFIALAAGLGILVTMVAAVAVRRSAPPRGAFLATLLVAAGFALLIGRHLVPSGADFYLIFGPGVANGKPASLKFIEDRFLPWPTHPLALSLFALAQAPAALPWLAWLLPALALAAAWQVGGRLFAAALPAAAEGFGVPRAPRRPWRGGAPGSSWRARCRAGGSSSPDSPPSRGSSWWSWARSPWPGRSG